MENSDQEIARQRAIARQMINKAQSKKVKPYSAVDALIAAHEKEMKENGGKAYHQDIPTSPYTRSFTPLYSRQDPTYEKRMKMENGDQRMEIPS